MIKKNINKKMFKEFNKILEGELDNIEFKNDREFEIFIYDPASKNVSNSLIKKMEYLIEDINVRIDVRALLKDLKNNEYVKNDPSLHIKN